MTPKAKRTVNIVFSTVLLTIAISVFCWFNVRGAELTFLDSLPTDCEVTITKRVWPGGEEEPRESEEFTLTQEQFAQLLDLVQSTSYWRDPSSVIYHHETAMYFVSIYSASAQQFISIDISGGYAIRFGGHDEMPYNDVFLRIRNDDWLNRLDAILSAE